jgi:hypothetical protein
MAQEGGAQQNYVPPFGGIPAPPSYYDGVPMQAWGSGAAIPPPFCDAQRSLCGAICTSSSTTTKCGHHMQNIAAILTNANQMGEGNANVAYVLGHLHLAPSDNS